MPQYWKLIDRTAGHPDARAFRVSIVEPNAPLFQAAAGAWLSDDGLAEFVRRLEGTTAGLHDADSRFPARMAVAWRRFLHLVPDLSSDATVYLVPAPRSAIGGAVRPLADENALIFGADEVSTVVDSQLAFDVLAQHEMTHLYHMQVNPEMRQMIGRVYMPPYATDEAKLYQVLWLEGLAAYMSKTLNPTATDEQVYLSSTVASDVRGKWPSLKSDLLRRLTSSQRVDIDAYMFDADTTGKIPRRAGYYIGSVLARELAKTHSFQELCRLKGDPLRVEIESTLRKMAAP